jgi:hypothetical protein
MTLDPGSLEEAIRGGDADRVRALLRDATETERRACAKALAELLKGPGFPMPQVITFGSLSEGVGFIFEQMAKQIAGVREEPPASEREYRAWRDLSETPAFIAAAVGLAGGRAAAEKILDDASNSWEMTGEGYDPIAAVLADRNPDWLAELAHRGLAARFPIGLNTWPLARRLVRLGAIGRPDVPEYTTKMPGGLSPGMWGSPLGGLLADPGLLDDEVWRLFTVPGAARELLEPAGQWADALAVLAERGLLDRGRLLDACLDAFVRDFPANAVGWYLEFHDRLAPAFAEIAARSGRYLALLAAPNKPGVSLGQRACGALVDAGVLSAPVFLAASGPALAFPQKSVATAQLKLIGKIAAKQPPARDVALVTAAQAFGHVREDVQQAALQLIARHGLPADPAARASIIVHAAALSPSLAPDAVALGLVIPAGPEITPDLTFAPSSSEPQRSGPVTDPAELVQLLARLMEDASDSLAVERAMAGAVRLAALPVAERARLAGPLLKRAAAQAPTDWAGPFSGLVIRADMAWLTQTWATGQPPDLRAHRGWGAQTREQVRRSGTARTMAGILSARIWEACTLVASGDAGLLLAEPEFADGTISRGELLARLARPGGMRPPGHDLEVALLRLEPGAGEEFWAEWARLDSRSADVARRAYAEGLVSLDFEPCAYEVDLRSAAMPPRILLPVVTARLTSPLAASPDPASRCWRLLTDLDNRAHAEHGRRGIGAVRLDEVVAAWPLLCPHQPELIAAHLLRPLTDGLVPGPSAATVAAGGLAPAGRPFGPIGHLALVAGLASAEPDTRITAASVWTRIALDGRLGPGLAAGAIALGVNGQAFKPNRIADGFQHTLPDPAAAVLAAQTLTAAAALVLPARPAGLHLFLETAARAMATTDAAGAVTVPPAIAGLAGSGDRTKLAEAARRLIRLTPGA